MAGVDRRLHDALIEVPRDCWCQLDLSLGVLAHEVDPTARRIRFPERDVVGGAVGDAQTAVDAIEGPRVLREAVLEPQLFLLGDAHRDDS